MELSNSNTSETDLFKVCPADVAPSNRHNYDWVPAEYLAQYFYSDVERLIIMIFFPVCLIIGLVGNLAFLFVLWHIPYMRTITNAYLANLAVSDLLFICCISYDILVGFALSPIVKSQPMMWAPGCIIHAIVSYLSHFVSVIIITLMSFERYMGICKPLQHRIVVAKGRTIKLVLLSWALGLGLASAVAPNFALFQKQCIIWPKDNAYADLPNTTKRCLPVSAFFSLFHVVVQTIPFTISVITLTILYTKIIIKLSSRVSGPTLAELQSTEAVQVRNQVARLLMTTGIVFFVCYMPYLSLRVNGVFLGLSENKIGVKMSVFQYWVLASTTINAIINPLIYNMTNARYRQAFKEAFLFKCNPTRHEESSTKTSLTKIRR